MLIDMSSVVIRDLDTMAEFYLSIRKKEKLAFNGYRYTFDRKRGRDIIVLEVKNNLVDNFRRNVDEMSVRRK